MSKIPDLPKGEGLLALGRAVLVSVLGLGASALAAGTPMGGTSGPGPSGAPATAVELPVQASPVILTSPDLAPGAPASFGHVSHASHRSHASHASHHSHFSQAR